MIPLQTSHAFHTDIVSPANAPLRRFLESIDISLPTIPVTANVDGSFYPMHSDKPEGIDTGKVGPTDVIARQLDRSSRDDVWCRSPYLPRSGPQTSSVFNRCCHSWGRCEDIINKSPQSRRHCHFPRLNRVSGDQWEDADNRRMGQGAVLT